MNAGMYPAVSGALAAQQRLDTISSNLAGAQVPAFKRGGLSFESYITPAAAAQPALERPILTSAIGFTDYSQGPLRETGNVLDLALEGDGFFAVETPGGIKYTRNGTFRIDVEGFLATGEGHRVLSGQKQLSVQGRELVISPDGTVTVDGAEVGRLDIVAFARQSELVANGNSLYDGTTAGAMVSSAQVRQGAVEQSNINTVTEMVGMIEASRHFELCTKVIQTFDETTAKASTELGRV